MTRLQLTIEVT